MATQLPEFSKIEPQTLAATLATMLTANQARVAELLAQPQLHTWNTLIQPLELIEASLAYWWAPLSHLHAVAQTPELRVAYENCLPQLTQYNTVLAQNEALYAAVKALAEAPTFAQLDAAQRQVIANYLRDFRLAGIGLPAAAKTRYAAIQLRLAQLSNTFATHVLDATAAWTKHVTEASELAGIPAHVLANAQVAAKNNALSGWSLTLDFPCYFPIMTYADNRALRAEIYHAYVTRASVQGPQAGQFDNAPLITETLALRHELSQLLNFANYAELSLATKMVEKPAEIIEFLQALVQKARPQAFAELATLTAFAKKLDNITLLEPWDIPYYSEKLLAQEHQINDEILRPYFPVQRVLTGLFALVEKLYGIKITESQTFESWHPEVRLFAIHDQHAQLRGHFYLDLFARSHKRDGAWMDDCRARLRLADGALQTPIAFLTCNLTPPTTEKPALLTHDEVLTIFHEFGHGLHHLLTKVDYLAISGISGVAWDAVELPS